MCFYSIAKIRKAGRKVERENEGFVERKGKVYRGSSPSSHFTNTNDVQVMNRAVVFGVCYRGGRCRWAGSRGKISDVKINLKTDSRMPNPYKKRIIA